MLVTEEDRQALWDNIDIIDCFATDHGKYISMITQSFLTERESVDGFGSFCLHSHGPWGR